MKTILMTALFFLASSLNLSYAFQSPTVETPTTQQKLNNQVVNKDNEIVALLIVVNKNQMALAKKALKKAHNNKIKAFAITLDKNHARNLRDTLKLGVLPYDTEMTISLKKEGKQELIKLKAIDPNNFDESYINSVIKSQQQLLALIDAQLRVVKNPKLQEHLVRTRAHIIEHLQLATKMQKELSAS